MKFYSFFVVSALSFGLMSCASQVVQPTEYSGYLGDYSHLQETKSTSGAPIKRWIASGTKLSQYNAIYIKPTVFYPEAKPSDKVSQAALDTIARRCDEALARELQNVQPLVKESGPRVLVLAPAITAVNANKENMKPYEIIPIAMVVGAVGAAAGTRDEDSNLYVEVLVSDGQTGQAVAKSVRKIHGETLENSKTKISGSTFDRAIRQAAIDARGLFSQY